MAPAVRTIFFGTPEIAVPALRALAQTTELSGVVSQPDRPAGRGLQMNEPAVKRAARELGVEVFQPAKVRDGALAGWLRAREPDVAVVMAYGRILPEPVLSSPRLGCLNLHASLLPELRGAAPIQWALIRGAVETGISLMQMDAGMDTGPVFCERRIRIDPDDDAESLATRLANLAAEVVREELPRAVSGELRATPQDESRATTAPPLTREDAHIDWSAPALAIVRRVRGLSPRPGAFTMREARSVKLLSARVAPVESVSGPAGTVVRADRGALWVAAGEGAVELIRGQVEGKRPMSAQDLVNGRAFAVGDRLT